MGNVNGSTTKTIILNYLLKYLREEEGSPFFSIAIARPSCQKYALRNLLHSEDMGRPTAQKLFQDNRIKRSLTS